MLARDTTYGDALFFPFLSIVVIIVVNQWTGNSTGFLSKEVGCNKHLLEYGKNMTLKYWIAKCFITDVSGRRD